MQPAPDSYFAWIERAHWVPGVPIADLVRNGGVLLSLAMLLCGLSSLVSLLVAVRGRGARSPALPLVLAFVGAGLAVASSALGHARVAVLAPPGRLLAEAEVQRVADALFMPLEFAAAGGGAAVLAATVASLFAWRRGEGRS